jgi:hypothetical protein
MIQFLGIHLGVKEARAAFLGRDLVLSASTRATMLHGKEDPTTGTLEVPVAEWVRAGCYAIQEAYFQLPVKKRKPWGLALSGPSGWIALDVEYQPLSPIRIPGEKSLEHDLRAWMEAHPRAKRRTQALLFPKDYFRFVISGGLATDVSEASRQGLLIPGKSQWETSSVEEQGLSIDWLPPVFDSSVPTGRLSEEGMRRTSLPGGCWLVAGSHEIEACLLAAGPLGDRKLRVLAAPDGGPEILAYGVPDTEVACPEGWSPVRAAHPDASLLEMPLPASSRGSTTEREALIREARERLEGAGYAVRDVVTATAGPELGAALLAALGSGMVKSLAPYYAAPAREGDVEAPEARQ